MDASAVQLQQVWVDPAARGRGNAKRGLRDLLPAAARATPAVCLFVRAENAAAIRLYERVGMRHVLDYRSMLSVKQLILARHAESGVQRGAAPQRRPAAPVALTAAGARAGAALGGSLARTSRSTSAS